MSRVYPAVSRRRPAHWWNQEIAALRKTCIRAKRNYFRRISRTGPESSIVERDAYKQARKSLRIAIRSSQEKSWAELCTMVDNDQWGVPYRIVTKKLNRQPPGIVARGRELMIADTLFPTRPTIDWSDVDEQITVAYNPQFGAP